MTGVIVACLPQEQGVSQKTGQPWVSAEYVLCHEQGQYPRHICFRVFGQEKIQQMNIQQGEQLAVHLNFDSKPSSKNGKYYNSVDCWRVDRIGQQMGYAQPGYAQQPPMQGQQAFQQPQAQQPAPFPSAQQQQQQQAAPFPPAQPQQVPQPGYTQPQGNGAPF